MSLKIIKNRLDAEMLRRGLVPSREKARALIMAGKVLVDGMLVDKPGHDIRSEAQVAIKEEIPYVSRGGVKLAAALDAFSIDPTGQTILDAGASTGGFSHCLLLRGASKVIAIDVGYGQFHWTLRNDPRITLFERTNIRFLERNKVPGLVDGAVADLAFISLKLVLPKIREFLPKNAWVVALVKPQFEVGRMEANKGVVRDFGKIRAAVDGIKRFGQTCGFKVVNETESPLKGPKGNREFLIHLITTDIAP